MARIRSLKPEAFQSETLANVSLEAERTFLGLSTQADDRGRFRWQPKTLNGILWSERGNHAAGEFEQELKELQAEGALCQYLGCDGKMYGHLINWDSHQRVDKPSPSRIPPCLHHPSSDDSKNRCLFHEDSCQGAPDLPKPREDSSNPTGALATDLGSRILDPGPRIVDLEKDPSAPQAAREDVEKLCIHFSDRVEANGAKRPPVNETARKAARLMLDTDKRSAEEAHRLIDWCTQHQWWHSRVLSMAKFREKYDQMLLQAKARGQPSRNGYEPYRNPADQSEYDRPLEAS